MRVACCGAIQGSLDWILPRITRSGRSAAWLARLVRDQEVEGSNPFAPTIFPFSIQRATSRLLLPRSVGNWVHWVQHRCFPPKIQNPARPVLSLLFYTERPLSTLSTRPSLSRPHGRARNQ